MSRHLLLLAELLCQTPENVKCQEEELCREGLTELPWGSLGLGFLLTGEEKMAQGEPILCINTSAEHSLFKGNIWESQLLALVCSASESPWLLLAGVCRARHPRGPLGMAQAAEGSLKAAERSKARLKSLEEFTFAFDMVCLVQI